MTTPKTTFRLLLDFTIRYALDPRFAEARYSSTIEGLVEYLTNLASPPMVSGRIYGGYGVGGFETLRPEGIGFTAIGSNDISASIASAAESSPMSGVIRFGAPQRKEERGCALR